MVSNRDIENSEEDTENSQPEDVGKFARRIARLLRVFDTRQKEVLRLVTYVEERAAEIDSAAQKARSDLREQLGDDVDESKLDDLLTVIQEMPKVDRESEEGNHLSEAENREVFVQALHEISEELPDGHESSYLNAAARAIAGPLPGSQVFLLPSLLVTLVGELETVIGELARACIAEYPNAADGSEKRFTWAEIAEHDSLESFRNAAVDEMINDILRGTLSDWMSFFETRFKISPVSVAREFKVQEVFQRRHCIVHNAGNASARYVRNLEGLGETANVGDFLEVTPMYILEAADELLLVLVSLVWSLGEKLCADGNDKDHVRSTIIDGTYHRLIEKRYDYIIKFGKQAPLDKLPDGFRLIGQTNVWLAYKYSDKFHKVRDRILNLDVATRSNDFRLAKYALLDDYEEGYKIAYAMLRDGELSKHHFMTWPLLNCVREYWKESLGSPALPKFEDGTTV